MRSFSSFCFSGPSGAPILKWQLGHSNTYLLLAVFFRLISWAHRGHFICKTSIKKRPFPGLLITIIIYPFFTVRSRSFYDCYFWYKAFIHGLFLMPVPLLNPHWKKFVQKVVDSGPPLVLIMMVPGRWAPTGGKKKRRQKRETVFNQVHKRIRKHIKPKRLSLNRLYELWKHSSKINASLERKGGRWGLKHRRSDNDRRLTVL